MDAIYNIIVSDSNNRRMAALATSVVILISAFTLAKLTYWLLDRFVQHRTQRTEGTFDGALIAAVQQPLYQTLLLLGLAFAVVNLGLASDSAPLAVVYTLVIFIWFFTSIKVSRLLLKSASNSERRVRIVQSRTLPLFENLAIIVAFAIAAYFVFITWEINISAWVASAGIVGLAISFAAKDSLANLFAGVFILADGPYKLGDFVVLDSGERGCVTHIGIRSTRLLTRDDVEITIPNSIMGNTKIINETAGPHEKYRIRVQVGVAYGSDIDAVRALLMKIANESNEICQDPAPRVRFRNFGDSSLDLELLCWVEQPVLRGKVLDAMYCEVYKRFNAGGIEFPYPKRDVYIKTMPRIDGLI